MKDKLTLSIDKQIKERAKKAAHKKGKSVSQMVEEYLSGLPVSDANEKVPQNSIVAELSGSVPIPDEIDYQEELAKILEEKYNG